MGIYEMNSTIEYYNNNAEEYYGRSAGADLGDAISRFAWYLPDGARIIDIGCGSGRDTAAFIDMGYDAVGLDASVEMARVAREMFGIEVIVADMASWVADEPYDGVWCCASLLHLGDSEVERFFGNLRGNVADGGVVFVSVKTGIETGIDENGRFMRNFDEDEIHGLLDDAGFEVKEVWKTEDGLGRDHVVWLNVISLKRFA